MRFLHICICVVVVTLLLSAKIPPQISLETQQNSMCCLTLENRNTCKVLQNNIKYDFAKILHVVAELCTVYLHAFARDILLTHTCLHCMQNCVFSKIKIRRACTLI